MRFLFFSTIIFLSSCAQLTSAAHNENQYWYSLVGELQSSSQTLTSVLESSFPSLLKQIKDDGKDELLKTLWGESLNVDSGAKKKIVDDKILSELNSFFTISSDNHITHAGVIHTYGYLFSNLETPYGYKRKRWIDPEVNIAFSFKENELSPDTKEGTLLSNISYFAGKIAFIKHENLEQIKNVSPSLKKYNYKSLKITMIEETIDRPQNFNIKIRTHFVQFPKKLKDNDYLLIYSIYDSRTHGEKLITVFPVNRETYFKTTDPLLFGVDRPILPKYNLHLTSGKDIRFSGTRLIYTIN